MNAKYSLLAAITFGSLTVMTACARTPEPIDSSPTTAAMTQTKQATVATTMQRNASKSLQTKINAALPPMVVHKSASCGCCGLWVEHMHKAGFAVEVRNSDNLNPIKERVGVPMGKGSCHTAEVGGYFIEGHVPAEDIKRLLAQKPDVKGLVLPGMPAGSPGMEMPDGTTQPYTVELVKRDGSSAPFAQH